MITAIIPCYNAECHLPEALASVQKQTRPVDEIIVVDDCSTDSSAAIAIQFGVRLLRTPQNQGHAAARNLGIQNSAGEILVWLDSDDVWEVNHVATVVGLLEKFPEAAIAYSGIETLGNSCWHWDSFPCEGHPRHITEECFERTIVPAMSVATRRHALLGVDCFDADIRVSPDFDLWLRLSLREKFVCTREVTAYYRQHEGQISEHRDRQLLSVYRSRIQFLAKLAGTEHRLRGAYFQQRLLKRFEADLWKYWFVRDEHCFRALVTMATEIPNGQTIVRRLGLRRYVPNRFIRWLGRATMNQPAVEAK